MKKGKAKRAEKDWQKGNRRRHPKHVGDDQDQTLYRERIKPKGVDMTSHAQVNTALLMLRGTVTGTSGGRYMVRLFDDDRLLDCTVKRGATSENENATLVVIGDYVRVTPMQDDRGRICHVELRTNRVARRAVLQHGGEHVIAANLDMMLCMFAADRADFRRTIIDRYVVGALLGDVQPVLILNKMDMVHGELRHLLLLEMKVYQDLGYAVFCTSTVTGEGIDELKEFIKDKTVTIVGQSGVGKSTMVNVLAGTLLRQTSDVRRSDRKGVHTTTNSVMVDLPSGGHVIDTPGLKEFGFWDLLPEELDGYFTEFAAFRNDCKYIPCTHSHEPGCAVAQAVEDGLIDEGRFASYLSIFESLKMDKRQK